MEDSKRLDGKDLINVGIYTAIYFVISMLVAMTGLIPVFMLLLVVLIPLIAAIPFVMYLTKVKKTGMLFISAIIIGILLLVTGMGIYPLVLSVFTGAVAELIWKSGSYAQKSKVTPTYAVFNLWMWSNYLPYFLNRDTYIADRASFGDAYWQTLDSIMPVWMLPVLLVVCVVCSVIGAAYAKKVLAKKLDAAGIR